MGLLDTEKFILHCSLFNSGSAVLDGSITVEPFLSVTDGEGRFEAAAGGAAAATEVFEGLQLAGAQSEFVNPVVSPFR